MEFTSLNDFLQSGLYLQNGDYVYRHDKADYPLQKDVNANELYVIIASNGHKLDVISFSGQETSIDLEAENGFWWVLKLPEWVRKKIGL